MRALVGLIGIGIGAASALAADLGQPSYTLGAPVGAARWDGVYFGLNVGGFITPSISSSIVWFPEGLVTTGIPNSLSMSQTGAMGGAQVGFNKQWGGFILGAEADFDFAGGSNASKSASAPFGASTVTVSQRQGLQSLGGIRGKIGFAPVDDLLIYATGGLAYGRTHMSSNVAFANGLAFAGSSTNLAVGFAVGGGLEYAFDPRWSIGAEFLYYNLGRSYTVGTANVLIAPPFVSPDTNTAADFQGYVLRLTLNYAFGADLTPSPAAYGQPPDNSEFAVTLGVRAGLSNGRSRLNLYDISGSELVSRLTYHDTQAATAELYGAISDRGGLFGKAYVGLGRMSNGTLQDEDFPPGVTPYSSTNSSQQFGELAYGTVDVGYYGYQANGYKLGGLAGWNFLNEDFNAFGCVQTATNPDVCATGLVASNNLGISDNDNWNAPRLGLAGEATLPNGFTARAEAAWLPIIFFNGQNTHFLRIPQNFSGPIPETGLGHNGYELEGEIDYWISPNTTVGVGARYWALNAKGNVDFQDVTFNGAQQVATFETQRFQAFAQMAYHF